MSSQQRKLTKARKQEGQDKRLATPHPDKGATEMVQRVLVNGPPRNAQERKEKQGQQRGARERRKVRLCVLGLIEVVFTRASLISRVPLLPSFYRDTIGNIDQR
jgi:hypothetical protein